MERLLEDRRMEETGTEFKHVRRGWCLGDTAFKKELYGQMNTRVGAEHYSVERQETAEARAESIAITLGTVPWTWGFQAQFQNGSWNVTPGNLSAGNYQDSDVFPLWTGVIPNQTYQNMIFCRQTKGETVAFLILAALIFAFAPRFLVAPADAKDSGVSQAVANDLQAPHCEFDVVGGMCHIVVRGNTNLIAYRPLLTQAYLIHVFDMNGEEISKTFYGRRFGLPLNPDKTLLDGSWSNSILAGYGHSRIINFAPYADTDQWVADIPKSFRIKEPGRYRLRVELRLFTKDTNNIFKPYILPAVETNVTIYSVSVR